MGGGEVKYLAYLSVHTLWMAPRATFKNPKSLGKTSKCSQRPTLKNPNFESLDDLCPNLRFTVENKTG